jgi:uncharacterized protein
MKVEVIRAWPRRHAMRVLELPEGATLAHAVAASGIACEGVVGYAVFGERATGETILRDGDRVELLGPLLADPKETRRARAKAVR